MIAETVTNGWDTLILCTSFIGMFGVVALMIWRS